MNDKTAHAMQVGHALNMLAELPLWAETAHLPTAVRVACFESYFINLRVLFEFFCASPNPNQLRQTDFSGSWAPSAEHKTLFGRHYGFASEQVAHLAKSRVSTSNDGVTTVSAIRLWTTTWLVLQIADEFVAALVTEQGEYAATFADYVSEARQRATLAYDEAPASRWA